MTGPEHYAEAERLIREVGPDHSDDTLLEIYASVILARAQVHATLAHAAAYAAARIPDMNGWDAEAWQAAAGTPRTDPEVAS